MRRKSKTMINTSTEISFWKEKNDELIKELVQYKNLSKQMQQDMDYMVKEKFHVDQKFLRLEEYCSILNRKTRSCLDKIVNCSTDLTEILGLLNTVNKIGQSDIITYLEAASTTSIRPMDQISNCNLRNQKNQNALVGIQLSPHLDNRVEFDELPLLGNRHQFDQNKCNLYLSGNLTQLSDIISQEPSFVLSGGKNVSPEGNSVDATTSHKTDVSKNDTHSSDKQRSLENAQEEIFSHESSFISRGGKAVLPSNPGVTSDMELEMYGVDDTEVQNCTPEGKVLSVIYEDWEASTRGSPKQGSLTLPDASSEMTLQDTSSKTFGKQVPAHPTNVNLRKGDSYSDNEDMSTNVEPSSVLENSNLNCSYPQVKNITVTPKRFSHDDSSLKTKRERLSFIERKSIGSPRPSMNGRTSLTLSRKSTESSLNLTGKDTKRLLSQKSNSPVSPRRIKNLPAGSPFLDGTMKLTHELSMDEFIRNTSTPKQQKLTYGHRKKNIKSIDCKPIRENVTSGSSYTKKVSQKIGDEVSERTSEDCDGIESQTENNNSITSLRVNNSDPNASSLRVSKRRRCPTINPLQRYLESLNSQKKSIGGAKRGKNDIHEDENTNTNSRGHVPSKCYVSLTAERNRDSSNNCTSQKDSESPKIRNALKRRINDHPGEDEKSENSSNSKSKKRRDSSSDSTTQKDRKSDEDSKTSKDCNENTKTGDNDSTSSMMVNNSNPNESSSRYSKRTRCPTTNPIQQYLDSVEREERSRNATKKNKFNTSIDDEPSVDEQTGKISSKVNNSSTKTDFTSDSTNQKDSQRRAETRSRRGIQKISYKEPSSNRKMRRS